MKRASILIEALILMILTLTAVSIMLFSYYELLKGAKRFEERYLAELTAENVLFLLVANKDIPGKMNGFELKVTKEGSVVKINVGEYSFEYEVNF